MMPKRGARDFLLQPWRWTGFIAYGGTIEDHRQWVKKIIGHDFGTEHTGAIGHSLVMPGEPWFLWVHTLNDIPALAHEALHIVFGVLQHRGLSPTEESEEAYTYTLTAIMEEALKKKGWKKI